MADFSESLRRLSSMAMPVAPDMDGLLSTYRRNIAALSAANKVALEGAQAVARRHMEIVQQAMGEMGQTVQALASTASPQQKAAQQADLLKQSYERALANARELRDMMEHANAEALGVLNARFIEAMEEVKGLLKQGEAPQA